MLEVAAAAQRPGPANGTAPRPGPATASSTSTASPRQNRSPSVPSVISTTTRSPGSACRTKTTRASGSRQPDDAVPAVRDRADLGLEPLADPGPARGAVAGRGLPVIGPVTAGPAGPRPLAVDTLPAPQVAGLHPARPRAPRARAAICGRAQLVGHRGDHDAGREQQPALEPQRGLVVQQLLPPAARRRTPGCRPRPRRAGWPAGSPCAYSTIGRTTSRYGECSTLSGTPMLRSSHSSSSRLVAAVSVAT